MRQTGIWGTVDGRQKEANVTSMCQVNIAGSIPATRVELIHSRFGDIRLRTTAGRTILEGRVADQSAVRALLNLLWDVGGDIRSFRVTAVDES